MHRVVDSLFTVPRSVFTVGEALNEKQRKPVQRNGVTARGFAAVKHHYAKQRKTTQKTRPSIRNPLLYPAELRAHN